jgi:hypothetical protein
MDESIAASRAAVSADSARVFAISNRCVSRITTGTKKVTKASMIAVTKLPAIAIRRQAS